MSVVAAVQRVAGRNSGGAWQRELVDAAAHWYWRWGWSPHAQEQVALLAVVASAVIR